MNLAALKSMHSDINQGSTDHQVWLNLSKKKKIFSFKKIKKANFSGSCSRNKKRGMSHDV